MTHTPKQSLTESLWQTGVGFFISMLILHRKIPDRSILADLDLVFDFTIASLVRQYVVSRIINWFRRYG